MASVNRYVERVAVIEARLHEVPSFQTYSHYWLELIELQRLQIHVLNKTTNKADPDPLPVLEVSGDDHRKRVFDNLASMVDELMKTSRPEFLDLKLLEQEHTDFIFASNSWWRNNKTVVVQACFTELAPVEDIEPGALYSKKLFALYQSRAEKAAGIEGPYSDFGNAIRAQLQRIEIGDETATAIGSTRTMVSFSDTAPDINPFDPDAKATEANFLARKKWAASCLETTKEATLEIISGYLRQLRSAVDTTFLTPLRKRRSMIGDLEVLLYVISGMITLFRAAPRPSA